MGNFKNLEGQRINDWQVTSEWKRSKGVTWWHCICTRCNKKIWVRGYNLMTKATTCCRSCYNRGRGEKMAQDVIALNQFGRIDREIAEQIGCGIGFVWRVLTASALPHRNLQRHGVYAAAWTAHLRVQKAAKVRALEFSIPFDQFFMLITSNSCFWGDHCVRSTLVHLKRKSETHRFFGLDRIDPNRGYTLDNVIPSCRIHNTARHRDSVVSFAVKYPESVTGRELLQIKPEGATVFAVNNAAEAKLITRLQALVKLELEADKHV